MPTVGKSQLSGSFGRIDGASEQSFISRLTGPLTFNISNRSFGDIRPIVEGRCALGRRRTTGVRWQDSCLNARMDDTADSPKGITLTRFKPSELAGKRVAFQLARPGVPKGVRIGFFFATGSSHDAIVWICFPDPDHPGDTLRVCLNQSEVEQIARAPAGTDYDFGCIT